MFRSPATAPEGRTDPDVVPPPTAPGEQLGELRRALLRIGIAVVATVLVWNAVELIVVARLPWTSDVELTLIEAPFEAVAVGALILVLSRRAWRSVLAGWEARTRHMVEAEAHSRYTRGLIEANPDPLLVIAPTGAISDVNAAFERLTGLPRTRLTAMEAAALCHDRDRARTALQRAVDEGVLSDFRTEIRHVDGDLVPVSMRAVLLRGANGEISSLLAELRDLTELQALEEQLLHQALHDPLTGLPNRALFRDRLEQALAHPGRHRGRLAVLFIDLDRFKLINDSLGHLAGDQLLIEAGQRIRTSLRTGDTLGRFAGDEFVVLLDGTTGVAEAVAIAARIVARLELPFLLDGPTGGQEVFTGASIGVALANGEEVAADDLLRDADVAMYRAKRNDGVHVEVFDPAMNADAGRRLLLESDLRRAVERAEFQLHYQPIVSLTRGVPTGVEALVRWNHPGRGLLFPGDFIETAEATGMITAIGRWVLPEACRQLGEWQEADGEATGWSMSVNLSAREFRDPELVDKVAAAVAVNRIDPASLALEITESSLMDDPALMLRTLTGLKLLGVKLLIDDFGLGYSSLAYLKRLPVDGLKLDRTFAGGVGRDPDEAIVAAVLGLGRALGLAVTIEGVETSEQMRRLRGLGCDLAQGYYFSRPLPPADVPHFFRRVRGVAGGGRDRAAAPTPR